MNRRTIALSGKITDESINELSDRMLTLQMRSSDPINLIINSGGGSMFAALRLCDLIDTVITAPVHGVALGACGSAATFVMLHCKKRLGTRHSRFLIHSGTRNEITLTINQTTSEQLEQLLKETKMTEEMVIRLYMTKLTPKAWSQDNPPDDASKREFVLRLIGQGDQRFDQWLSTERAIEIGLIEEIAAENFGIFRTEKEK